MRQNGAFIENTLDFDQAACSCKWRNEFNCSPKVYNGYNLAHQKNCLNNQEQIDVLFDNMMGDDCKATVEDHVVFTIDPTVEYSKSKEECSEEGHLYEPNW